MKLRGRFTVTLALAALVPIAVAAVVTRQVIARSYRSDYQETRRSAEAAVGREVARLSSQVQAAVASLASRDHPFVGGLLRELIKKSGLPLDVETERRFREQGKPVMRGLSLDVLAITDPDNRILISPHFRDVIGESNHPEVRERATKLAGKVYFTREQFRDGATVETALVAEAAATSTDSGYVVALWAGRKVTDELLAAVRRHGRVDARVVTATGELMLPGAEWSAIGDASPIRTALNGPDGAPVAYVEVAVSDGGLDRLLRNITLVSAALAALALAAVVILGWLVARRTARDLDRLVEGSLAAARGELEYRVPVRSADEVGAVAAAFNFMMEDLRTSKERLVIAERIAAWQEIARRLAHEIKNPLTPIQMAMDTLRRTWKKQHPSFDEILEESTTTVLQEADRLKHIVTEFSDFARMPKPEFQRLDLNDVVRAVVSPYQGAGMAIEVKLDRLPQLDADKNQLNQVILNLVENARDAIAPRGADGRITVATRMGEAGDRALLVVDDNGPGVPQELKDKVFAPYFTTKHANRGTGLGLAIVHRIISDHGGRIFVGDAPGGGARFTIELPLRNGEALLASRI